MTFGLLLPCRQTDHTDDESQEPVAPEPGAPARDRRQIIRDLLVQGLLLGVLLVLYRLGRTIADGQVMEASHNAADLHAWEQTLGLPDELSVQNWLLDRPDLARLANAYYASVHFPLTALALVWLYLRRPSTYAWTRTVIVSMTAIALCLTFLVPLAPPRLMPDLGFTDVAAQFGPSVYGGPTEGNANQYAAMPSLHVGWALLVAIALVRAGHTRWRWLWLLHPLATLLVVVGTANHYWLDAGAAVALLGLCCAVAALLPSASRTARWLRIPGVGGRATADPAAVPSTIEVASSVPHEVFVPVVRQRPSAEEPVLPSGARRPD
jgi:hypothetical protein